uniref:Uncharacterized protein n=1 Tax=Anguilla anguilla TaxID=7936 RepID=A0A0E9PDM5_ANGAN
MWIPLLMNDLNDTKGTS